jgi:hypothetical protein
MTGSARPILALAFAALVLIPASASAKELESARICGADDCTTVTGAALLSGLLQGGATSGPPEAPAAFYTARLAVAGDHHESWTIAYLPSAGLVRSGGESGRYDWTAARPATADAFARATRGIAPFPASRLRLRAEAPRTRVVEVVPAPPDPPPAGAAAGGGFPWTTVGVALGAAALLAVAGRAVRGRGLSGRSRPAGT